MNLNSLDIENNILLKHCGKSFSLYKFFRKHVSVWCQKKHLHCTMSWHPRTAFLKHLYSCIALAFLYIFGYLIKNIFVPKTLWDFIWLAGGWWEVEWFPYGCLLFGSCGLIFQFFILNETFWKFNYFSAFQYFHR